jgi:hypothetical protein
MSLISAGERFVLVVPTHVLVAMGDFDMDQIVAYRCRTHSKTTSLVEFPQATLVKLLSVVSKFEASYNDLSFLNLTRLAGGAKLYASLTSSGLVAARLASKHRMTAMLYTADPVSLVVHSAQVHLSRDERVQGTAYNAQALHDGDTSPGDSGAPLFDGKDIVGFHTGYRDSSNRNVARMFPLHDDMIYGYEVIPEHGGFAVSYGSDEHLPRRVYNEEDAGDRARSSKDFAAFGTSDEDRDYNPNYSKKQNKNIAAVKGSLKVDEMLEGKRTFLSLAETEERNKKSSAEKGRPTWADVSDEPEGDFDEKMPEGDQKNSIRIYKAAQMLDGMLADKSESFTLTDNGIVQVVKKVVEPLQVKYDELVELVKKSLRAPDQSKVTEKEYVEKVQDFSQSLPV